MANITIPNLPSATAATDLDILVIVDSGETTTSKITKADLLSDVGNARFEPSTAFRTTQTDYEPLTINSPYSQVLGGSGNTITTTSAKNFFQIIGSKDSVIQTDGGDNAQIIGGVNNTLTRGGFGSTILGGQNNSLDDLNNWASVIAGGESNTKNSGRSSGIFVGKSNTVEGPYSAAVAGDTNFVNGSTNFIGGGALNLLSNTSYGAIIGSYDSDIFGGNDNAMGIYSSHSSLISVNGGIGNVIIGGQNNTLRNFNGAITDSRFSRSALLGGYNNKIADDAGTANGKTAFGLILGGKDNSVKASTETIRPTIISSDNCVLSATTGSTIYGSVDSSAEGTTNTHLIGVSGYTATTDNIVVVPQLVMTDYSSLNFSGDTAAASGGVILGGVYHDNGTLRVRIS